MNDYPHQSKNSTIIIAILSIITLIAVCVAVYFGAAGRRDSAQQEAGSSNPSSSAEQAEADNPADTSDATSDGGEASLAAPAITDPQSIEIIKQYQDRGGDTSLSIGSQDAPVVLIEFSDFSCPYCSMYAANTHPRLKKYIDDGTLRIELYPFAIFEQDYASDIPARAAWAAGKQGKFAEFFEKAGVAALSDHPTWTDEQVTELAREVGVPDLEKFAADLNSDEAHALIDESAQIAQSVFGVTGTPAFFVNNRVVSDGTDVAAFEATIEAAAADVAAGAF